MKFLVITRPNGSDAGSHSAVTANAYASELRELIQSKTIEAAYAFIGGGSAYVVHADTAKQLAILVRGNPLFSAQAHEIIPVADAHDFLEGVADHIS